MGLPATRDLTLAMDTPMPSSLGNALQDCIIGAKHPEMALGNFGAAAWQIRSGAPVLDIANSLWTFPGIASLLVSLAWLRPGTRLTKVVYAYDRNNTGTISAKLMRRDQSPAHAATETVQQDNDAASGAGWTNKTWNYNHVIASGYSYWLELAVTDATHKFGSGVAFGDRL